MSSLPQYTALIRTRNSAGVLPETLRSLNGQSSPPAGFVIVDSGSTDETLQLVPPNSKVHRYEGANFNYSSAINQGIAFVESEITLIVSSHTTLEDSGAIAYALQLLRDDDLLGGAYFSHDRGELSHTLIDRRSFNGFNGLWNTCALVRTNLVRCRPFRPEVFSAEDQEWAQWFLTEREGRIARVAGAGMSNQANPNLADGDWRKWMNEYVAIAYFVRPDLMGARGIGALIFKGINPRHRRKRGERRASLRVAARLARSRVRQPDHGSQYFAE